LAVIFTPAQCQALTEAVGLHLVWTRQMKASGGLRNTVDGLFIRNEQAENLNEVLGARAGRDRKTALKTAREELRAKILRGEA
jgi:hypothetical protein